MQAILLNDLPNFFSYSSLLSMEFPIQFIGQVFFWTRTLLLSKSIYFWLVAFFSLSRMGLQPFHLNWYFLIKWENLLVFQSISVANDVYSVIIKHMKEGKKLLAPQRCFEVGTDRGKKNVRNENRGDFLSMHIIASKLKRGRVKIDGTCAQNVWIRVSCDEHNHCISIHPRIYLCNSIWLWERSFSVWHCGNQQHNTQVFSVFFGGFIFIHFVQNLPSKKCSTASILLGAHVSVWTKETEKERFGANTTCWCYNWFFLFSFRRFSPIFLSLSHTHKHTQIHISQNLAMPQQMHLTETEEEKCAWLKKRHVFNTAENSWGFVFFFIVRAFLGFLFGVRFGSVRFQLHFVR